MNTRRKIWALGCCCVGIILTGAVLWAAIETWAIYKSEMIWIVSVHRVRFMMANGRLPIDGREMNIWFGRGIGNGDWLPPVDFEGGIFNCGNRDQKSLDDITRLRVAMVESAASFSSRLELMGIDGKCRLQTLIAGFKDERNPFDVRYEMLRQIGVYLVLSSNDNGGDVEAGERQSALNLLWDVGKDETSPFCGIALYGLARNVDLSERKEFQGLLRRIAKSDMSCSICRAAAIYLLTETNGRRCPVGAHESASGRWHRISQHDDAVRTKVGKGADSAADASAEDFERLSEKVTLEMSEAERAQMASDKNQVMDELLNQSVIPADYGERMIALYRDGEQDVFTRDFAVQHIGLYAQALKRRGKYSPESPESASLRRALDEAARETKTIIAAAAFRALSDMSEFDPNIDGHRLDSRLVACISDSGASVAARVVAVQLCGERRIGSARSALADIASNADTPETLRRSAIHASALIGGK